MDILKKLRFYFEIYKNNLLESKNRKKYLIITGALIIVHLLLINLYVSYGYYYDKISFSFIKAVVGNINLEKYDYILLVYTEDMDSAGNGNGTYHLTESIPTNGYNYSGYKCENNSTLLFDESTMVASVTTNQKDVCSIYFDTSGNIDVSVKIMLESDIGSNDYVVSDTIPVYGYVYSHYECDDNSTLEYKSELHSVVLSSNNQDNCTIYFSKQQENIFINLYVEENYQSGEYIEQLSIPSNIIYIINDSKTICTNKNNERIDTKVIYENGYIIIEPSNVATCDIYLDRNE